MPKTVHEKKRKRYEAYLNFNEEANAIYFIKRVKKELGLTMYLRETTAWGEPIQ